MAGLRLNVDGSILDGDERLVPGQPTEKDFVTALTEYLTKMKERDPDTIHPTMEWLENGFSMIALSRGQSVTMPPEPANLVETVTQAARHKMLAFSQPLAQVQRSLEERTNRLTARDVVSRQYQASLRTRLLIKRIGFMWQICST